MVSTLPVYLSSVSRVIACSISRQSQKVISYIELFYPSCIYLYNQMMGGVDLLGFFYLWCNLISVFKSRLSPLFLLISLLAFLILINYIVICSIYFIYIIYREFIIDLLYSFNLDPMNTLLHIIILVHIL